MKRDEFEAARRRGRESRALYPTARSARYDLKSRKIFICLSSGIDVSFSPAVVQGLQEASSLQLQSIEILGAGNAIHFPLLDADVYIPGLLAGFTGTKAWMSADPAKRAKGESHGTASGTAQHANAQKRKVILKPVPDRKVLPSSASDGRETVGRDKRRATRSNSAS